MRALLRHSWPLNVRELEHCLRAALALSPERIDVEHLPATVRDPAAANGAPPGGAGRPARSLTVEQQARRDELRALLVEHRGNISEVARRLGKDRVQVQRWIKLFALSLDDIVRGPLGGSKFARVPRTRMSRSLVIGLSLLLVGAVGCRRLTKSATSGAAIATRAAAGSTEFRTVDEDEGFLGMVIAPETVDVATQLESRVKTIQVRPGDRVERGAVLATLDTRAARQELAIARAELAGARTEYERTKLELAQADERLTRRQTVVELPTATVGTVSAEEVSSSQFQQKIAAVRVAAADATIASKEARFAELRALLAEGAVRAPFAGTIAARYVDVGAMIHKGAPLVRLIEGGELRVRFAIPEERADAIAIADPVRIVVGNLTLPGVVEKIAPEIDAASRMLFAEASIAVPTGARNRVRSGQVTRVRTTERAESALR
ncbi:MAG: HlyD family secretion protein [bacterium]|nr:HlyD family secretion protein [bacterium]